MQAIWLEGRDVNARIEGMQRVDRGRHRKVIEILGKEGQGEDQMKKWKEAARERDRERESRVKEQNKKMGNNIIEWAIEIK